MESSRKVLAIFLYALSIWNGWHLLSNFYCTDFAINQVICTSVYGVFILNILFFTQCVQEIQLLYN